MILGVLLCSGFSKRMGTDKLRLTLGDKSVVEHVVENILKSKLDRLIIIYGEEELLDNLKGYNLEKIHNPMRHLGQSEAVKLGASLADNEDGICFFMGDQPLLSDKTINKLIDSFNETKENIIIPHYGKSNGSPVIFPISLKEELLKISGDYGGKSVIRAHEDLIKQVMIDDECEGLDMDDDSDFDTIKELWVLKSK